MYLQLLPGPDCVLLWRNAQTQIHHRQPGRGQRQAKSAVAPVLRVFRRTWRAGRHKGGPTFGAGIQG